MKMLLSGSPSSHSCWQFPSISWTRPLLSDWLVGTSFAGCYASSQPPGPNRLSPAPLPWLCPIVALETEQQTVNGCRLVAGYLCQWLFETRRVPSDNVGLQCLDAMLRNGLCLCASRLFYQLLEQQPSSAPSRRPQAPSPGRPGPAGSGTGRRSTAGHLVKENQNKVKSSSLKTINYQCCKAIKN